MRRTGTLIFAGALFALLGASLPGTVSAASAESHHVKLEVTFYYLPG